MFDHVLRRDHVAERLRHFVAVLVEHEAVGEHDVERRAAASAAAFQRARTETSRDVGRSLRDTSRVSEPPSALRLISARAGKTFGSSSTKACVEPESNQTSRMSSTFCQSSLVCDPRNRSRAPSAYQASAPSCSNASMMREIHLRIVEDFDRAVRPFSCTNTVIGTPQARWREITQSGRLSTMPLMRFSPCAGTQRVALIAASARRRKVSFDRDILVHRNEPLRRVAKDHRLLRTP